jgi:hypothetical protein
MLNQSICRQCIAEAHDRQVVMENGYAVLDGPDNPWYVMDDSNWEAGRVNCPRAHDGSLAQTKDKPPKWCPFSAEHIVSQER